MSHESKELDSSVRVNSRNPNKGMTDAEMIELLIDKCDVESEKDKNIQNFEPCASKSVKEQLRNDCLNALSLFEERVSKGEEYTSGEKEKFSNMFNTLSLYCAQKASDDILNQIKNALCQGSNCFEVNEVIETIFYSILSKVNDFEEMAIPVTKSVEKLINCLVDEITNTPLEINSEESPFLTHEILSSASTNKLKVEMNNYRNHESDSWTDDESVSSSSSGSDFSLDELRKSSPVKVKSLKTKGEIDIEDLPPVEDLKIAVKEEELTKIGKIHGIVGKLVVVQALKNQDLKPLNSDSVLFLSPDESLGRIFEVFGPVISPYYTVLFNNSEEILNKKIKIGNDVFYCPNKQDLTTYVLVEDLRKQKGSDASWMDNNEPPDEFLDYSDDEAERAAKLKRRAKNRNHDNEKEEENDIQIISSKISCVDKKISGADSYKTGNFQKKNYFQRNKFFQSSVGSQSYFSNSRPALKYSPSTHISQSLENIPVWISPPSSILSQQHSSPHSFLQPSLPQPQSPSPQLFQPSAPQRPFQPAASQHFQPPPPQQHFQPPPPQQHFQPPAPQQHFQPPTSSAFFINVPHAQSSLQHTVQVPHGEFIPHPAEQQFVQSNFSKVQMTPITDVSPLPSSPMFRPSPVILVPPNQVMPNIINSSTPPAISPNPYWTQREHLRSPLLHVQNPPPNTHINYPAVVTNMPSPVRLPTMNFSIPPPRHTQQNNFYRFH